MVHVSCFACACINLTLHSAHSAFCSVMANAGVQGSWPVRDGGGKHACDKEHVLACVSMCKHVITGWYPEELNGATTGIAEVNKVETHSRMMTDANNPGETFIGEGEEDLNKCDGFRVVLVINELLRNYLAEVVSICCCMCEHV